MFDLGFGWSELLIIAIVALIIVGPKDLPDLMRRIGRIGAQMRAAARDFQQGLNSMAEESGLDDMRESIRDPELARPLQDVHHAMRSAATIPSSWNSPLSDPANMTGKYAAPDHTNQNDTSTSPPRDENSPPSEAHPDEDHDESRDQVTATKTLNPSSGTTDPV